MLKKYYMKRQDGITRIHRCEDVWSMKTNMGNEKEKYGGWRIK